jgi:hypothetical protein
VHHLRLRLRLQPRLRASDTPHQPHPPRRCTVADVLPELDALAGRQALLRAGRGQEYDPRTGKLRQKQKQEQKPGR